MVVGLFGEFLVNSHFDEHIQIDRNSHACDCMALVSVVHVEACRVTLYNLLLVGMTGIIIFVPLYKKYCKKK